MERIGLAAVLEDKNFRAGAARYMKTVDKMDTETAKTATSITKSTEQVGKGWEDAGKKVGVAMIAMGAVMTAAITKITLTAGRTEELGLVLNVVGKNVGKTAKQMAIYEKGVKAMGITTQASRQALVQMAQAEIDLSNATDLARLAQDAAVIAQLDSSEAFQQLITTIQRGSLVMARNLGLVVDFQGAYKRYADETGRSIQTLTQQEKIQIRVGEVMRNSTQIAGTYEAALQSGTKQMRSMRRYTEELANEFGNALLPAFSSGIQTTTGLLKSLLALPAPMKSTIAKVGALSAGLLTISGAAALAIPKILSMVKALQALGVASTIGLGPLGLIAGALALVGGGVIYLKELEKAHRDEAVAVLDAAEAYGGYAAAMRAAGLDGYTLSRSLYETAKAAEEAGKALDLRELQEARQELKELAYNAIFASTGWREYGIQQGQVAESADDLLKILIPTVDEMTKMELVVAGNISEMVQLAQSYGLDAKAALEFAVAMEEATKREKMQREFMQAATSAVDDHVEAMAEVAVAYDTADKAATPYIEEVTALAQETGLAIKEIYRLKVGLDYTDEEIKALGDDLHITGGEMADLADKTGLTRDEIIRLNEDGFNETEILEYADAIEEANKKLEEMREKIIGMVGAFSSVLAKGLIGLRDLSTGAADSAEDYEAQLDKLRDKMSGVASDVKAKWEETLPDPTTVRERMGQSGDVWDEWGLRLLDIMVNGVSSPWLAELEKMGHAKPPDVGAKEWAKEMRGAFYAGDLPGLIKTNTQQWQEHAAGTRAAQQEATRAVQEEVGKRKAEVQSEIDALKAAREEQLAIEAEARQEAMMEMAFDILEQTGQLEQWAKQRFGPDFYMIADEAGEAFDLITSGYISMDDTIAGMLDNTAAGISGVLDATAGQAEENKAALEDLFTGPWIQEAEKSFDNLLDLEGLLPAGEIAEVKKAIATIVEDPKGDEPFAFMSKHFPLAAEAVMASTTSMGETNAEVFLAMSTDSDASADQVEMKWVQETMPAVKEGAEELAGDWSKTTGDMLSVWKDRTSGIVEDWNDKVKKILGRIQDIKDSLARIPRKITVEVDIVIKGEIPTGNGDNGDGTEDDPEKKTEDDPTKGESHGLQWVDYVFGESEHMMVNDAGEIGKRMGDAFIAGVHAEVRRPSRWADRLIGVGVELSSIGSFFAGLYQAELDPIKSELEELDRLLDDQAFKRMLTQAEYNQLLERQAFLADEFADKQADILALEQAQADLAILEQQSKLFDIMKEWKLDPTTILQGLELGLDVSLPDMIAAMSRAIQAIVKQAEEDLGVASPSKVFANMAAQSMAGFVAGMGGAKESVTRKVGELMGDVIGQAQIALDSGVPQTPMMATAPAAATTSMQTVNVTFGDTNLADSMDEAAFRARVENTVRDAISQGG